MNNRRTKDTRVHLVQELQAILPLTENVPHVRRLHEIIAEAKDGEYHDYKNAKYVCGKVASYRFLMAIGTPSAQRIARKIRDGEFDEAPDDGDRAGLASWLSGGGS